MENNNILTEKIKQTVKAADASAQVLLFGSRARGDAKIDSDWDILILLSKAKVTIKDEQVFRHKLFDVELETGACISTFVYALNDWNTRMSVTPLYENVKADGIYL